MKNRKWLTYTLGTLLTLIVLAAVGAAGFRAGMMQNISGFTGRPAFSHNFDNNSQLPMQGNQQQQQGGQVNPHQGFGDNFQGMRGDGFHRMQGNFRGDDRRGGGMPFFSPIFGLIKLVVLGLLAWLGYKFVKDSGWKLTRVTAQATAETPSATTVEPAAVESVSDDEKKDEA